ncbi:MAG: AmmeMemoRadiSam system protein B [Sedimentisphaerales bacterium]
MQGQWPKSVTAKFLIGLAIVLLGIVAVLFWKAHIPEEPARAKPAKVVLRSLLAEKGWYPADANTLKKQIEGFFQKADVTPIDNVIALILPHAGYRYSGQVAASGLKTTSEKYKRVVIVGPSHYLPMEQVLSVPRVTHYETPLGQIPLDVEFINKLLKYSVFQNIPHAHQYEHSVQIELPLLQHRLKDLGSRKAGSLKIVPIVAGVCSLETITKAGSILKGLIAKEGSRKAGSQTLVIASSDFTHYGPRFDYVPFTDNKPEEIKRIDMGAFEHIARLDSKGFLEYKRRTGATICGYIPIAILLSLMPDAVKADLIKYATSGELTGDFTESVSYLSVAFSGKWTNCPPIKPQENNPGLTEEDKKQLLALARKTISYALQNQRISQIKDLGVVISDAMAKPRAAFVTLKKNSQLRGCIGDIFPQRPLYRSVIINAINASFNDRRFRPLTEEEFKDITIEISALTVPQPLNLPDEIRIGIDGVVLNKDGRSAVFLPQVAPEQGWDLNQMLTHLSLKAGLPAEAWKEGANFLVFQADVFGEER